MCIKELRVNTDSKIVCDAVDVLIPEWKTNNWRSLWNGEPIENRIDFENLENVIRTSPTNIVFNHIPGHIYHDHHNIHHSEAEHLARQATHLLQ